MTDPNDTTEPVTDETERPATKSEGAMEADEAIIQFFKYEHLPGGLQVVSKPYALMARDLVNTLPRNEERTFALRKLLESKDCAVRAAIRT